ncbi:PilN domain-containing protein [Geminicoccus roseus]|uniref:PilN domain-containing protein n=1 Tax=Geminicoccus roseus TaxID=404900 RepID=UPI000420091B|nr:PilN domain-containing protein [Geminicoccus roseus]
MSGVLLADPQPAGGLGRFWRWWTNELGALLPHRRRDPVLRKAVILLFDGMGFRAMVRRGTASAADLGRLDLPRPSRIDVKRGIANPRLVPDEQSIELARRIRKSGLPVVLRLPATEGLVSRDELPAAAERHLQEVLAHRVDVLTPWTSDQVAYDARVISRSGETGRIRIEATFAPRETIERLAATLAGFEIQPAAVDVAGTHTDELPRIDLLQGKGAPRSRWWMIALASVAVVLPVLSAVLFYDVWQRSSLVEERHQQELRLIERKNEADQAQSQRLQALADANFLNARKAERPSSLVALEIIARELPDDAWLSRFELAGNRITITGEASEAPRVLALIGADARFGNAALGNSSTRGPSMAPELFGLPVDRFTLTALLAPDAEIRPLGPDGQEAGSGAPVVEVDPAAPAEGDAP